MTRLIETPDTGRSGWDRLLSDYPGVLLAALGVLGVLSALALAWLILGLERARVDQAFDAAARKHGLAVERAWQGEFHGVQALAMVFMTSEQVTRQEFRRASDDLAARHLSARVFEWVPKVTDGERADFVERARRTLPGFEIREYGPDGELRPAPRRPVHFPIFYAEPLQQNRRILGLDPAGNGPRDAALHRAVATGRLAVSAPTRIAQTDASRKALLVFRPVFDPGRPTGSPDARRRALQGLVEGVYLADALVRNALSAVDVHGLETSVYALSSGDRTLLHRVRPPDGGVTPWYVWHRPDEDSWRWSVGGQTFETVTRSVGAPYGYDLRPPAAVLALGLLLSGAILGLLRLYIRRERHVRGLAEHRSHQLHHQATHDALTGIVNRAAFERALETALRHCHEDGVSYCLCYLDLDEFKVVNDIHGHNAGDDLLRQLAGHLAARMRPGDVFARLGGDEFGILLASCRVDEAREHAEQCLSRVNTFRFQWNDQRLALGVSIGITEINRDTVSVATALGEADAACNIAKEQGRNRIHVFRTGDAVSDQYRSQMLWAAEVRRALEEDRLELHGQPIVPCRGDARVPGMMEVLVRLRDRQGRLVPPGVFIPAAERYNLMIDMDRWVLERALSMKARRTGDATVWCVNLSGHSIGEEGLFEHIERCLAQWRVSPRQICFEVTETAVVRSLSKAERFVSRLRRLGCLVSLDDFGSGMSSFTYLKHLPVDFLKIDGSFVRNIHSSRMDRAMVHAMQEIAAELRIRTIAEYVEDATVLEEIRALGVDYAQGYYTGRPAPLGDPPGRGSDGSLRSGEHSYPTG